MPIFPALPQTSLGFKAAVVVTCTGKERGTNPPQTVLHQWPLEQKCCQCNNANQTENKERDSGHTLEQYNNVYVSHLLVLRLSSEKLQELTYDPLILLQTLSQFLPHCRLQPTHLHSFQRGLLASG